jgi:chemotaxis protein methyltransferase CheR
MRKLRETGCQSFEQYTRLVDRDEEALAGLVDALTTNFTAFLREPAHFSFLRERILPELALRPHFSIWCAAAATGEEPYSFAIHLTEALGLLHAARIRIVATDISTRALASARSGIYPASALASMPPRWMPKYFLRGEGRDDGFYQIKQEVAQMIHFSRLNLMDEFEHLTTFSLISCRNVMIYFDRPTQEGLIKKLTSFLEPGGYLFVGHSESLTGFAHSLEFVQPAIYRKPPAVGGTSGAGRCR